MSTGAPSGARRMVATVEFYSYAPADDALVARVRETIETHPTLSFRVVAVSVAEWTADALHKAHVVARDSMLAEGAVRAEVAGLVIALAKAKEALRKHGQHTQDCAYWSAEGRPGEEPGAYTCTCGLDAALAPAAPWNVSVLLEGIWHAGWESRGKYDSGGMGLGPHTTVGAIVDKALSSFPSPSPALLAWGEAGEKAIAFVNSTRAGERAAEAGVSDSALDKMADDAIAALAAAVAAIEAAEKGEAK